ncbi:MAG: TetR/AcrR family transcriptional regulator [Burkholderiaceae bacterium]|nr:TetR/AcrR family transcriptional regulator [Burkholderiaceae bacterium]
MQESAVIEIDKEKPGPRWKRRKDARPQELINAALSLFAEFGYSQTRLDDVAAKAGISKGTVYLYFASKQDLFEAVIRERAAPWIEAISNRKDDDSQSTEVMLREFLGWGWDQFLESQLYLIARIVLAESNNFPHLAESYLREVMGPVHEQLTKLLKRGVERGEVRGEISRERIKVLLAPLSWLALWRQALHDHSVSPIDERAYVREAIDMAIRSVMLPTTGRPPEGS